MAQLYTCTVVSIVPVPLVLDKIGIYPGYFRIPQADDDKPEVLHVGNSYHSIYLGAEQGYLKATDLAPDVARSIVEDFKRAIICNDPGTAEPGLFWVNKKVEKENVSTECAFELAEARELQQGWYKKLILMADDDWTKSGHRHRSVSDLQKLVAKKLGMEREWLFSTRDDLAMGTIKCPACKSVIDTTAIVCSQCKLILKPEEHKKLQFVAA